MMEYIPVIVGIRDEGSVFGRLLRRASSEVQH